MACSLWFLPRSSYEIASVLLSVEKTAFHCLKIYEVYDDIALKQPKGMALYQARVASPASTVAADERPRNTSKALMRAPANQLQQHGVALVTAIRTILVAQSLHK